MIVIPAIDIIGGKPVRLYQGDYAQKKIVAESVIETAGTFVQEGAERIHLVDLDGAKAGKRVNHELIKEVCEKISVPIEAGGGIRTEDDVQWYLDAGVSTVILGTAAIEQPDLLQRLLEKYGSHIAVGLDCRGGYAMASGWLVKSQLYYKDFARRLAEAGVQNIIFTDISRDGTLQSPNFTQLEALQKAVPDIHITASGGIRSLEDIRKLNQMGIYGAITGQAVYSGTLNLKEAIALTKKRL